MKAIGTVWREGLFAGLLGATGVAIWFLLVDLVAGRPFYTPSMLGGVLLGVLVHGLDFGPVVNALVYTVFHVGAFLVIGVVTSVIVDLSRRMPHLTIGLLLLFVVFEAGFYFAAMALSAFDVIGRLGVYQIGAANLLAAGLMGGFIWRRHPELKAEIRMALDGRA